MTAQIPQPATLRTLPPKRRRARLGAAGTIGAAVLAAMILACLVSIPYTFGRTGDLGTPRRYEASNLDHLLLPPALASHAPDERERREALANDNAYPLGSDRFGRDLLTRCLAGGSISLFIGFAAAAIAVTIGTFYGALAGYVGGRTDAAMMRIVDVLYGLPYVLLVVLLAVAADGLIDRSVASSGRDIDQGWRVAINVVTLLVAIGGVSWLTMARVVRGQVLSLKEQSFMEACRAIGVPWRRQFVRHLLPNLAGPIMVYATLTVPQAILQESFLSFLGIGVEAPLPSWGNLAAEGLPELNPVRMRWWLLFWPCLFLALTLLSLNFVGEGLRTSLHPQRRH